MIIGRLLLTMSSTNWVIDSAAGWVLGALAILRILAGGAQS